MKPSFEQRVLDVLDRSHLFGGLNSNQVAKVLQAHWSRVWHELRRLKKQGKVVHVAGKWWPVRKPAAVTTPKAS